MGEVVETSSHPINGKHGRTGRGGRLSAQSSPVNGFSCKAHTDLILHLTEECKCSLTEEDADVSLECNDQSTPLVGASCSEYK
jgi:hypothetical protein